MSKIEVLCFYYSYAGREVNYNDILNKLDFMDEEDRTPSGFWTSLGGFSITIDGFKTIYSNHNFYNMVKASTFLLNTVYWLNGKESDWFNKPINASELSIEFGVNEKLTIHNKSLTEISLSYSNQTIGYERKRGDRYFEDIVLPKQEWVNAVKVGLNEYFKVLLQIAHNDKNNDTSKIMQEYYSVWNLVE